MRISPPTHTHTKNNENFKDLRIFEAGRLRELQNVLALMPHDVTTLVGMSRNTDRSLSVPCEPHWCLGALELLKLILETG